MAELRDIIKDLKANTIKFLPGEHDASMDNGEAYQEFFGKTHYTFDHKGVHFITLDNVSDPKGNLGEAQLQWLGEETKKLDKDSQIIVLTHRPLFDLYPQWEWATPDGAKAIDILMPYTNVTVFYGHIHQEHHDMTWPYPSSRSKRDDVSPACTRICPEKGSGSMGRLRTIQRAWLP